MFHSITITYRAATFEVTMRAVVDIFMIPFVVLIFPQTARKPKGQSTDCNDVNTGLHMDTQGCM